MEAIVTKITPKNFEVLVGDEKKTVSAKGKIKLDRKIILGDVVEIENEQIVKLKPQKNHLKRPECCNVDNFIIIVAQEPEPDFNLVDLLIAMCRKQKINASICINKDDINKKGFLKEIKDEFNSVCEINVVSAKTGMGTNELRQKLKNITAFAGQSGVGKTSLINRIFGLNLREGALSEKTGRGMHTTTQSFFHLTERGEIVVDTPGFSFIDIKKIGLTPEDYKLAFPELKSIGCKYPGCSHTGEEGCVIKENIQNKNVLESRVLRYQKNIKKIEEIYKRRFN